MSGKDDEPPETTTGNTDEPPADEPQGEPPAETTAHEEDEKVPEWGKTLISQVESLTAAVTASSEQQVTPPNIDDNPAPKPWHKRGGK